MIFKKTFTFFIVLFIMFFLYINISFAVSDPPEISAQSAILIDSSSGEVFYDKNSNQVMFPASTTKIMTAILTLENGNLNDIVTVPYAAISNIPAGYSIAALQSDEQLTVNQLLQMMMVYSANDAANVLAFYNSGSIENFANLMNQKAAELGMSNTHFTNPSGMQDENHYTTASDLAILMKYSMKNNTFRHLAGLKLCSIPATNKYQARTFYTTNNLLVDSDTNISNNSYYEYAIAGKTGFTSEAGNCLVSVANKDDLELICVVLAAGINADGSSSKFSDSKKLFEFGYANYGIKTFIEQGYTASTISIANATPETKDLDLVVSSTISALMETDKMDDDIKPDIRLNSNLFAPISQGQVVGKIVYTVDGVEYSSDLIASHNVVPSDSSMMVCSLFLLVLVLLILFKLLFPNKKKTVVEEKKE